MSILKSLGVIVGIAFLMILKDAASPYLQNTGMIRLIGLEGGRIYDNIYLYLITLHAA